jgi:hypothetical protein
MTKVLSIKKQLLTPKSRTKNIKLDKRIKAFAPGKRRSKTGKIYYEKRENRTDVSSKYPYL